MSRLLARFGVVLTAAVALVVAGGSVAVAHVSVHADTVAQGDTAEIAFRVPTESDTASTVSVKVAFPTDAPIAKVAVLAQPGWDYEVTRTKLSAPISAGHGTEVSEVVSQIEWRAASPDAGVKPGEYQQFRIAAGPLPKTDRLVFKVVQTYDDGQVQRWIDEPVEGEQEPEHPAPVLALDAAATSEHGHGGVAANVVPAASSSATPAPPAWWAAVTIALVAMIAALGAVFVSLRTTRHRGGDQPAA
ncbi:YcnI family protein [Actinophytocola sp.]|uniref:YcnI family copper-binding membrane protein n=1 Tax=Actinophytocola sp. TaxID=1872138 RepID=UPI002ED4D132